MRRFIEKKNIFFLLVLIGIFGISFSVFALELNWPESPGGIDLNTKSTQTITYLIAYIYEWAMAIGGIAVFITLVSAGFQYLTSAGDITKMSEAKKQITSTITGLVLLLSTFLILSTINPELTTLDIPEITLSTSTFGALDPFIVSYGQICDEVLVYPESEYSGGETKIAKGEEGSVTINKGEGSIKFISDGTDTEDGCTVKLYNSYNEDENRCDGDLTITVTTTQEDLSFFELEETVKCVSVE